MSFDQSQSRRLEKLVKRLKKFSEAATGSLNEKKAERYLVQLHAMRLTAVQLQGTGLAATVTRLRKLLRSDAALSVARRLVKDWRLAVEEAAGKGDEAVAKLKLPPPPVERSIAMTPDGAVSAPKSTEGAKAASSSAASAATTLAQGEAPSEDEGIPATAATETTDPMRIKCREMLQQALELVAAGTPTTGDATAAGDIISKRPSPRRIAVNIESAVFADFGLAGGGGGGGSKDAKYKTRIRSLLMNLRDPKNPGLRHCLLRGTLAGADVARMTPEQLASDDMKRLREKMAKDAARQHQGAGVAPAEPGCSLFACKRCRKKNCTYNQLQTLSGDEPMTTYVLCNECGFRWKFN